MKIKGLAFWTLIVTYILIVFGGYVASSQSGMGCGPDWPTCNGEIIPNLSGATLVEFTHRFIGAILSVMTLVLMGKVLRSKYSLVAKKTALWMIGLLIVQILLGAFVVFYDLPTFVISIHLLVAMAFMSCVIWFWKLPSLSQQVQPPNPPKHLAIHFSIIIGLLAITIGLSAIVKHQTYGLACGWLDCYDGFFPSTKAKWIQSLHRFFAAAAGIYIWILTVIAFAKGWDIRLKKRLILSSFMVLLQIFLGIITVETTLNLVWAVLHLAGATALFAVVMETRIFIGFSMKKQIKLDGDFHKSV